MLEQGLEGGLRRGERTDDVDAMHLDERRRIDVEERARGAAAPGVQHDGVEPAEPLDGRRYGRPGGRGVGGVAGERKAVDLRGKSLERLAPSTGDRDRVSVGGEPPCGRGTDPRPPARDESDPVVDHHAIPSPAQLRAGAPSGSRGRRRCSRT